MTHSKPYNKDYSLIVGMLNTEKLLFVVKMYEDKAVV